MYSLQQPALTLRDPRLSGLAIELTNVCNFKCSKCWSQTPSLYPARKKGFMSEALFYQIRDELKAKFPTRLMIVAPSYAGESMLHPKFEEFSRALHDLGFRQLQLATNGTQLNAHTNQVLLEAFDAIAVSIHKQPGLSRVLEKTKKLYNTRGGAINPTIRLNFVAEEFTQDELNKIGQKLRGHCDTIKVITYISEDMKTAMTRPGSWPVCLSMFTYLAVLWNGETLPCCHILSPGNWSLGNVGLQSLHEVFYGEPYRRLREDFTKGTLCEACEVRR